MIKKRSAAAEFVYQVTVLDILPCFFTRLLRINEDLEVKTVGMQLQELRNEKKSSCCGGK